MKDNNYPYPEPTAEQLAEADELEAQSRRNYKESYDSFERCDTDGYLSQWANDTMGRLRQAQADILRHGGYAVFSALFDLDGNLVAAKLVDGRFGLSWGILENDDPHSRIVRWIGAFPARPTTMQKKGYYEGTVLAPAYAKHHGNNVVTVGVGVFRKDHGFSRDVIVVDNGKES